MFRITEFGLARQAAPDFTRREGGSLLNPISGSGTEAYLTGDVAGLKGSLGACRRRRLAETADEQGVTLGAVIADAVDNCFTLGGVDHLPDPQ